MGNNYEIADLYVLVRTRPGNRALNLQLPCPGLLTTRQPGQCVILYMVYEFLWIPDEFLCPWFNPWYLVTLVCPWNKRPFFSSFNNIMASYIFLLFRFLMPYDSLFCFIWSGRHAVCWSQMPNILSYVIESSHGAQSPHLNLPSHQYIIAYIDTHSTTISIVTILLLLLIRQPSG